MNPIAFPWKFRTLENGVLKYCFHNSSDEPSQHPDNAMTAAIANPKKGSRENLCLYFIRFPCGLTDINRHLLPGTDISRSGKKCHATLKKVSQPQLLPSTSHDDIRQKMRDSPVCYPASSDAGRGALSGRAGSGYFWMNRSTRCSAKGAAAPSWATIVGETLRAESRNSRTAAAWAWASWSVLA